MLGKTSLHFVDPGTKINGKYYRDVLLMRGLLPDIRSYSQYFTFQQDGAPAHRARETVDLLKQFSSVQFNIHLYSASTNVSNALP